MLFNECLYLLQKHSVLAMCIGFTEFMTCCYVVSFTDGAFKAHLGKVYLVDPPLSTVMKLLCLQHVAEVVCKDIQDCEVSISVRSESTMKLNYCKAMYGREQVSTAISLFYC